MFEIKARQSVFIHCPAEEIFACLSDLETMTGWCGALVSLRKMTPEAICPGTIVKSTIRFFERWLEIVFEIVEYEPGRYLSFKSISGSVPCLFCYQFEPAQNGGTTLLEEATIQIFVLPDDRTASEVTASVNCQLASDLLALKELLEEGASA